MPLNESYTLAIVCDNPQCPGNELDPASREGWTFASVEVAGAAMPTQKVFCSFSCLSRTSELASLGEYEWGRAPEPK